MIPQNRFISQMMPIRCFSSSNIDELKTALHALKDKDGKSILDSKAVHSYEITEDGKVSIRLVLNKDYRKMKSLVQKHLETMMPQVKSIDIKMAPQDIKTSDE